jgi:hypothetical protein
MPFSFCSAETVKAAGGAIRIAVVFNFGLFIEIQQGLLYFCRWLHISAALAKFLDPVVS